MKPVAKGTTKKFIKLEDIDVVHELSTTLTDEFTGRLQGVLKTSKGDLDVVIEIVEGKIIAAGISGYTSKLGSEAIEEIIKVIPEASGFLEVVELDKEAVNLDLEFNPNAKLKEEIGLRQFINRIAEVVKKIVKPKPKEEKVEEKQVETTKPMVKEKRVEERPKIDVDKILSSLRLSSKLEDNSISLGEDKSKLVNALLSGLQDTAKGRSSLEELLTKRVYEYAKPGKPLVVNIGINGKQYSFIILDDSIVATFILNPETRELVSQGISAIRELIENAWGREVDYMLGFSENDYLLAKLGVKKEEEKRVSEEKPEVREEKPKGILGRLKRLFGRE